MLTQLAALITALTGLIAALYQAGVIGSHATPAAPAAAESTTHATPAASPGAPNIATAGSPTTMPPVNVPDAAPPSGSLAIAIGDTIADGKPATGAGRIESPGTEDTYHFSAAPGQRVFFRMLEASEGMTYIYWKLIDANDQELFNTCLGCGNPGVQTLTLGGVYRLTVGNPRVSATGIYALRLTDVPTPDRFTITPAARIADGVPGRGAGRIETPGASDEYRFSAAAGQRVFFRMREASAGMTYINWKLTDANGQEIFSQCLGCGDPGMQTLGAGGEYLLTVGSQTDPATGTYRLELTTP